jgi:hypothetical protein
MLFLLICICLPAACFGFWLFAFNTKEQRHGRSLTSAEKCGGVKMQPYSYRANTKLKYEIH